MKDVNSHLLGVPEDLPTSVEFLIITALDDELQPIKTRLSVKSVNGPFVIAELTSNKGKQHKVLAVSVGRPGNDHSAAFTQGVLARVKPQFVLLVGIAGGLPESDVHLGDILVPSSIADYELGKVTPEGTDHRGDEPRTDSRLWNVARGIADHERNEWFTDILEKRPEDPDVIPIIRYQGVIGSGNKVMAAERHEARQWLIGRYKKRALGFEMEAMGLANACHDHGVYPFVVKAVQDRANESKDAEAEKDLWRRYACDAAAALAIRIINKVQLPTDIKGFDLEAYRSKIKKALTDEIPSENEFDVPVRRYKSFEEILVNPDSGEIVEDLGSLVVQTGAILLHGAGGSGKSVLLRRLALELLQQGGVPIFVDVSRLLTFEQEKGDTLKILPPVLLDRVLLSSTNPIQRHIVEQLTGTAVLVVDGFNELSTTSESESIQQRLLISLQSLRAQNQSLNIIIADRFNPRPEADGCGYRRLCVRPLEWNQVEKVVAGSNELPTATREILRIPFFLNLWVERGEHGGGKNKALMLREALEVDAQISADDISKLAKVAYDAYRQGTQYFDFKPITSSVVKLQEAGFLQKHSAENGKLFAKFSHELFHDYLAAYYIAKRSVAWEEDSFDVLSLEAQSFESIQLALEQVDSSSKDEFLIRVYDWSYIAAAVCLAEEERFAVTEGVSEEIRTAVIASIADKRFDIFPHSQAAAIRTLRQLPPKLTKPYFIGNEDSLRQTAKAIQSTAAWFKQWQNMFTRPRDSRASRDDIVALVNDNALIGWATANFLRRSTPDESVWRYLFGALLAYENRKEHRSKRWRIVHVLGVINAPEAVTELVHLLKTDEYRWVKYGSIRSLIEIAWRYPTMRPDVLGRLISNMKELPDLCKYELSRALRIGISDEWKTFCRTIITRVMDEQNPRFSWVEVLKAIENQKTTT